MFRLQFGDKTHVTAFCPQSRLSVGHKFRCCESETCDLGSQHFGSISKERPCLAWIAATTRKLEVGPPPPSRAEWSRLHMDRSGLPLACAPQLLVGMVSLCTWACVLVVEMISCPREMVTENLSLLTRVVCSRGITPFHLGRCVAGIETQMYAGICLHLVWWSLSNSPHLSTCLILIVRFIRMLPASDLRCCFVPPLIP